MKTRILLVAVLAAMVCGLSINQVWADTVSIGADNLLSHQNAVSSSFFNDFVVSRAVDGAGGTTTMGANDFVFGTSDATQRLTVYGFNSDIAKIRIWTENLRPKQVTIRSSLNPINTYETAGFETQLAYDSSLADNWISAGVGGLYYSEFAVAAPTGTRSLSFDFGGGNNTTNDVGFARVCEVQAFASVPEPNTLVMGVAGLIGLLAYAWRKQR